MLISRTLISLALVAGTVGTAVADDSDLDPTFGTNGIALTGVTDASGGIAACRPIVQPDGKILICGTRVDNGGSGSDFFVARFTADGQPDLSFSFDGQVTIDFTGSGGADVAKSIALQSDGKIVVAGTISASGATSGNDFGVARLTSDGTLDTTFGAGTGKKIVSFDLVGGSSSDDAADMAIQADGKIVVAGTVATPDHGTDFGVVRLLSDGSPDASFNLTGKVTVGFDLLGSTNMNDMASRVAIDSSGRIVISGSADKGPTGTDVDYAVARLLPNGTLDANFNADGRATVAFDVGVTASDTCYGLSLQTDGKILLSGNVDVSPSSTPNQDIGVARLQPDGSPDNTFGIDGKTLVTFDLIPNGIDFGLDIREQADGHVLVVGAAQYALPNSLYAAAVRLDSDGSLDAGFGTLGRRTYDFGLTTPSVQAFLGATMQGDDIIAAGIAYVPGGANATDNLVVRLRNDVIFANGFD
jgi:uncharacterized delta-60 repeat protein